jgi:hypothetical protein
MSKMEIECAICLNTVKFKQQIPCLHIFCSSCITKWTQTGKNTCPLCRKVFGTFKVASRKIKMDETLNARRLRLRRVEFVPPISPEWLIAFQEI